MNAKLYTFLFLNFFIGFISDIGLNDLSRYPLSNYIDIPVIESLYTYFKEKSIIQAGIYAGLTVLIVLLPLVLLFTKYLDLYKNKLLFIVLSFIVGYIADIAIEKFNIFGNTLKPYYKQAGSGYWGAVAVVFSVICSYFIQLNILPLLT